MAPGLQVKKWQGDGAEFRCVHVERAAYMYDTWHKLHQEN